jgi:hypothetical protein
LPISSLPAQQTAARPKELEVLSQYVGTWRSEVNNKPSAWDEEGTKSEGFNFVDVVLDGWFLHHVEVNRIVSKQDKVTKSLFLWTFEPNSRKYIAWSFQSTGVFGKWTGEWSPRTRTISKSPVKPPPNSTGKMTEQFLDADTIKGNLAFHDAGGKILMDMEWARTRLSKGAAMASRQEWDSIGSPIQPLPSEVAKLQPFVGEWDAEFVNGPSVLSPQESTSTGTVRSRWILDGRFLLGTTEVGTHKSMHVTGYDPDRKAYRYVRFTNSGQIDESVGRWDGETGSFVWNVVNERPGIRRTSITRVIGANALHTHILGEDNAGGVLTDLTIRSTRRKQPGG